jgi:hypothetical protein
VKCGRALDELKVIDKFAGTEVSLAILEAGHALAQRLVSDVIAVIVRACRPAPDEERRKAPEREELLRTPSSFFLRHHLLECMPADPSIGQCSVESRRE